MFLPVKRQQCCEWGGLEVLCSVGVLGGMGALGWTRLHLDRNGDKHLLP